MNSPKVFTIAELNARLEKVATANRYDAVAGTMRDIFANKNPQDLVTSSEFTGMFSKVANLNKQSDFRFHFSDIFEGNTPGITPSKTPHESIGATSRLAGYEEDFRPSPIELTHSDSDKIKNESFKAISSVLDKTVDNPQYHFNEFVAVAGYGKNSGFASWTVAFNTGKGVAQISVPTPVVDGVVEAPSVFYASAGKAIRFDQDSIKKYAQSYVGNIKQATTGSGIETLGGTSIITDRQNVSESVQMSIDVSNAFGGGTMVSEDGGAFVASAYDKKKMIAAIETARKFVESKIGKNVSLKYTAGMETDDNKHIIAFNVSKSTTDGVRVATIPVEVDGIKCAADAFYGADQQAHSLDTQTLSTHFNVSAVELDKPSLEAFTDPFLTTDATYKQLNQELKYAAFSGKSDTAKSILYAIGNRFGEETLTNAMDDFKSWTNEAMEVKAGKKDKPKEIIEREAAFEGVMKSSSIVFN
jgi:hypothetical protein